MTSINNRPTVLITGASSGIGLELARLFAADQYNMVLVARDEARLNDTAALLKEAGAGNITVIAKDLSVAGNAAEVYSHTKSLGLYIDILVNDAGVGEHGKFAETDLDKELAIIQLNISSLVQLTKLYLKDMLASHGGKILQLASIASYQPTPLLAVYAATKAFVLSFSDSLINELEGTSVTLTALIPMATDTGFFKRAGAQNTKAAQDPQNPETVAREGYEALMKGEHHAYAPGAKAQILMSSVMSNDSVASMARKQMEPAGKK